MTVANTLKSQAGKGGSGIGPEHTFVTAFNWQTGGDMRLGIGDQPTALSKQQTPAIYGGNHAVRRLTPTECCRLQGFPDDWLGPPNEPPDSPRYAALGDAVTVNVAHWIGQRILIADRARTAA